MTIQFQRRSIFRGPPGAFEVHLSLSGSSAEDIAEIMAPANLALLAADTLRESIFG
ncbi:MAG: hypothetical protein AB2L14_23685 [Candidatus Xenobiia bacterium LiM19]